MEAEVPGTFWLRTVVDDGIGAVLAETEAVDGVEADLAEEALRANLALYGLPRLFRATLFAVAARADEHVRLVVTDLRRGLFFERFLFLEMVSSPSDTGRLGTKVNSVLLLGLFPRTCISRAGREL